MNARVNAGNKRKRDGTDAPEDADKDGVRLPGYLGIGPHLWF